jgi:hypothetical protein
MNKPLLPIAIILTAPLGCAGNGGVGPGQDTAYTLDLKGFGTAQTPGGLQIANETLA